MAVGISIFIFEKKVSVAVSLPKFEGSQGLVVVAKNITRVDSKSTRRGSSESLVVLGLRNHRQFV